MNVFEPFRCARRNWLDYLGVEQPVNVLLGLGHCLFLPECQGTQSRSGK